MKPSAATTRKTTSRMRSADLSNPAVGDGSAVQEKDIAMITQNTRRNTPIRSMRLSSAFVQRL